MLFMSILLIICRCLGEPTLDGFGGNWVINGRLSLLVLGLIPKRTINYENIEIKFDISIVCRVVDH